jgi:hypothetical protein
MTINFKWDTWVETTKELQALVADEFKELFRPNDELYRALCPFNAVFQSEAADCLVMVQVRNGGLDVEISFHENLVIVG